jgi:hypothetical protein
LSKIFASHSSCSTLPFSFLSVIVLTELSEFRVSKQSRAKKDAFLRLKAEKRKTTYNSLACRSQDGADYDQAVLLALRHRLPRLPGFPVAS